MVHRFKPVSEPYLTAERVGRAERQNLVYIVRKINVSDLWLQPIAGGSSKPLTAFTSGQIYNLATQPTARGSTLPAASKSATS